MSWTSEKAVRLTTKRFIIRSMVAGDVTPTFLRWQNDSELRAGQNLRAPRITRDVALKTVKSADNARRFYLLICASIAETPIGFFAVNIDASNKVGETIVVIGDRHWWGKSVVTEARAALLDFLFDEVGLRKVVGKPHARNLASLFNYRAQGFTCEGVLRDQLMSVADGTPLDQMVFGLLRDEWQNRDKAAST